MGDKEDAEIPAILPFMQLRVLIFKSRVDGDAFVAQCLETGNIATADDYDTVRSLIFGVLAAEVEFNMNGKGSTKNLFSAPASRDIWKQFYELSMNRNADYMSGVLTLDATY